MPLDQPVYNNEKMLPLASYALTSSGCVSPALALDNDPSTATVFGTPASSTSNVTANISSSTVSFFAGGAALPAGQYQIAYVSGALNYTGGYAWAINSGTSDGTPNPRGGNPIHAYYLTDGTVNLGFAPGVSGVFTTAALCESANSGQILNYNHAGGPLGVYLHDNPFGDNAAAPDGAPVFSIGLLSSNVKRVLRVDFDTDCPVTRIRLGLSGAGANNAGVALVPSLPAYESPIPIPYPEADVIYGPVLPPLTGQVKDVVFDPPFLAKGVIFYPDFLDTPAGGQPALYPAVMLNQLQVYEQYSKGVNINMAQPLPTVQWTQVGVQAIALFPWNGATGPYDPTTKCNLYGLQTADLGITVDTVEGKGGESIFDIFSAEVGREYEIKLGAFKIDVRTLAILQGGRLGIDPASGNGDEVQAHSPNFTDRAPDLRLFLQTTVGDGQVTIVLPRCKAKGAINWSMKAKEIIIPEFTVKAKWDPTYIAQDGGVGGICDFLYGDKGTLTRHS